MYLYKLNLKVKFVIIQVELFQKNLPLRSTTLSATSTGLPAAADAASAWTNDYNHSAACFLSSKTDSDERTNSNYMVI